MRAGVARLDGRGAGWGRAGGGRRGEGAGWGRAGGGRKGGGGGGESTLFFSAVCIRLFYSRLRSLNCQRDRLLKCKIQPLNRSFNVWNLEIVLRWYKRKSKRQTTCEENRVCSAPRATKPDPAAKWLRRCTVLLDWNPFNVHFTPLLLLRNWEGLCDLLTHIASRVQVQQRGCLSGGAPGLSNEKILGLFLGLCMTWQR